MRTRRRMLATMPREAPFERVERLLKNRQRKDAWEVANGIRSARSLWAIQPGSLDGFTFTPNPKSEYEQPGKGW